MFVYSIPFYPIENFAEFRVELGSFWSSFLELCYVQSEVPLSHRLEIMCDRPIVAQYVRIMLNVSNVPLRMCEVEIYGGTCI